MVTGGGGGEEGEEGVGYEGRGPAALLYHKNKSTPAAASASSVQINRGKSAQRRVPSEPHPRAEVLEPGVGEVKGGKSSFSLATGMRVSCLSLL